MSLESCKCPFYTKCAYLTDTMGTVNSAIAKLDRLEMVPKVVDINQLLGVLHT